MIYPNKMIKIYLISAYLTFGSVTIETTWVSPSGCPESRIGCLVYHTKVDSVTYTIKPKLSKSYIDTISVIRHSPARYFKYQ